MGISLLAMQRLHPQFCLNGASHDAKTLGAAAQTWVNDVDSETHALGTFILEWLSDDSTVSLQTSGSTGIPKQLEATKTSMRESAQRTAAFFALKPGDTALLCLPVRYIAGKMMLVRAMTLGLSLDVLAPKTMLELNGKSYDFAALIPLQAQQNSAQLKRFKTILIGGAPINTKLRKVLATIDANCIETYGMTETLTHVATRPVTYPPAAFQAMPGIGIAIDSDNCLVLNVPYASPSPIITHDVVKLVAKDSFELLGRKDWVINSGGKKIIPEQLEETLDTELSIPFFFTSFPDKNLGEQLVLVAEAPTTQTDALLAMTQSLLGADKHHIPKRVICLDIFVYTDTGKLDRKATQKKAFALSGVFYTL